MHSLTREFIAFARRAARAEDKPFSLLLLAGGVIITLFQYWEHLDSKKVEVSYQHVQEWEEAGYKDAFNRISQIIRASEAGVSATFPNEFTIQQKELARLNVTQRLLVAEAEGEIGKDIDHLMYFFDKLSVCVDRELCDRELLDLFFKDNLTRLWIYSSSFVASRREEIRGYAELAETYRASLHD